MRRLVTYLLFIFIIFVGGCNVKNLDLSNYPEPFAVKGQYSQLVILVVGTISSSSDTFAAVDIATGLRREFKRTELEIDTLTSGETKERISKLSDYNLIIIGSPCVNPLADTIAGEKCDTWALKSGEALIKLFANGDKVALLVAGTYAEDTRRAARILRDYKNYTNILTGTEVILRSEILDKVGLQY